MRGTYTYPLTEEFGIPDKSNK